MKRLLHLLFLVGFNNVLCFSQVGKIHEYQAAYNACSNCEYSVTGNSKFFDDGGEDGVISDNYQLATFTSRPGYNLSFYFTQIDLPKGALIRIYTGNKPDPKKLIETFATTKKAPNIISDQITVEYIPVKNTNHARGWIAHIDERQSVLNSASRVMSQPESDCPYAIPLCANNTVIALGGLYNDLGNISDDDGSCYGGTGSGGSVWYSFTPQASGPIDFTIFPSGTTDYDFVLWDINNGCQSGKRNELACNYSLYTGITGLSGNRCSEVVGTSDIDCGTSCSDMSKYADCNRFDNRVNVTVGKQYAICVNFYSGSNDGFTLKFQNEAGSVAITDVIPPVITNAYSSNCVTASNFHVTFSEWIDCSTLNNGDFTLAGHTFSVVTSNCFGNRTNNIDLAINPPLTSGTYTVHTAGIKDLCGNPMNSDYNIVIGTPPTPAITPPVLVCKATIPTGYSYTPSNQTLTASGGTSYYWYDGQVGASANFPTTSPKTISVTVVRGGCSGTASVNINVDNVTVDLGPDQYYCGTPVTLTATPNVPGNTYQWYRNPVAFPFSNGTLVQSGTSNVLSGLAPGGYTTYRVIVTNANGCKAQDDVAVKTNPGTPQISYPGFNFCLGANPVLWTANPAGGVFSGPGMSNDTFYPSRAGVGTWTINYTLVTPCGTFSNSKTIRVSAGTTASLGLNSTYCYNDTITHPIPNPKCGTYDGPGITTGTCTAGNYNPNFPNIFNPALAGVGPHIYTYYNAGCANTQVVTIIGPGTRPVITGAGGPYCTNSPSIVLTGTPSGGNFVGPGMTGSTFNPATAGPGTHTILYSVTKCGIAMDTSVQIQVNSSSPSASISYAGPFCSSLAAAQNVTRTGTGGGTYTASPAGLTIDPSTGAITPSTSSINTYTVTYTIASAGGCPAFSTNTSVTITAGITPTFAAIGPLCQNSVAPSLPSSSTNATPITGTWSPAAINTTTNGTTTYTFTPNAGQCASTTTLNVTITSSITPTFAAIGPLCQNSVAPGLPSNSTNAIAGTWNPATITTTASGTSTYTFTPTAGQCAAVTTMNITITGLTTPTFAAIGPLCQNSVAPSLPANSTNAIAGTWSPATINTTSTGTTTYTFTPNAGQCASTTTLNVTITTLTTPTFSAIGPLCQNSVAPSLPANSLNGISGTWNPATINTTSSGTTTYTFTPNAGQCASSTTLNVTITTLTTPTFAAIGPLCQNSVAPSLLANSINGIAGTWSPATINTSASGTTTYTFTPNAGQCASSAALNITITALTTPTFSAIGQLCQNSAAPSLPVNSTNGIAGTWNPSAISTSASGTSTYTFTPNAGQCASTTTLDVTINGQSTPAFSTIGPLCQNAAAPSLPLNSTNGISGTWNPATISTGTTGTTTYTFTPNAGQCAVATTMDILITLPLIPAFASIGPLCQNSVAPPLPVNSTNAIAGTWNPSVINTTTNGTTTYTFTPNAGQCATATTMDVTISSQIIPAFAVIGPLCQNSAPPSLPANSSNGIAGTWSPSTISTSASGTSTYTFTPNAGQCATTSTLDITIDPLILPAFAAIPSLCQNAAAPSLPLNSTNGIAGTWSPATISTSISGTSTYTFTPNAGQCAAPATMDITVDPQITATFNAVPSLCQNAVPPVLPSNSNNGITGTWNPSAINTTTSGTTTYTFTPNVGQCAVQVTMDVTVTPPATPTFATIGPLCQNSVAPALPLNSINGIAGTWNPSIINTTANGTTTYTFTPNAGQCATATTMDVTISSQIIPAFAAIGPLCQNSAPPSLPGNSSNGIAGTWSPSTINTSTTGTATYAFTPSAGQCAAATTLDITVDVLIVPAFAAVPSLCQNSSAPLLPPNSLNGIAGTWNPATVNTSSAGTSTYTFTPDAGQCAAATTLDVTINAPTIPAFAAIPAICQNAAAPSLSLNSTNGISGTWSPSTINTSVNGTFTYAFTPDAGQCAATTTLDITITAPTIPAFAAIPSLCQNSIPPSLPVNSTNGISGTWNPSVINTSASGTSTYTFTPNAGQCATAATLDISIDPQIVPAFAAVPSLCQNSIPPALPLTSSNGINGTWNSSVINTSANGTTTYTFTPAAGQCASITTMDVTVGSQITPVFTPIATLCENSAAPLLPAVSNNGITGAWNPSTINTSSAGTATYTFTPDPGQCAIAATLDVTVIAPTIPTFNAVPALCQNSIPASLPNSNNGISGTWNPATINTSTSGTSTYTFTPDAGQCATPTTLDVSITLPTVPTFAAVSDICQNSIPSSLPVNSTNGISGTWNPSAINTSSIGTSTYTFTPDAGQCATTATLDITITTPTVPTFSPIASICENAVAPSLPLSSTNGINGTWNPSTINTSVSGTSTYTFTPAAGECATTATLDVTIIAPTVPAFASIPSICQNATAPSLQAVSLNGISGTWNPSTINTSVSGPVTYTFTPDAGQCATTTTLDITVIAPTVPAFAAIAPICQKDAAPSLPSNSTNGISGTWNPSTIDTSASGTSTYTFIPDAGQCALATTLDVTVTAPTTPTFAAIPSLCQNSIPPTLPANSTNGISGIWNPSLINTSTNGTTTYTFTPDAGQCATTTTLDVTVTAPITPTFTGVPAICQNSIPSSLPVSSTNGISGVWNPSTINTSASGTSTYTFTPNAGQCATTTTLDITIDPQIVPSFASVPSLCQNSIPPLLSSNSTNGIAGSWSPAVINTSSNGTTTYTFTPNVGQCASVTTMDIVVASQIIPQFAAIAPLCQNSAAPSLPLSSINGITGTWNPAAVSTAVSGTTTYTFTPDAGQCAIPATLNVTINPPVTPTFAAIAPLCQNAAAPSLPTNSTNGFSGTWIPAIINTAVVGTTTHTFSPDAGQCATTTTTDVKVNAVKITDISRAICQGQSVTVGSQSFNSSGNYSVHLNTSDGCDSLVNLALTVNPIKNASLSQTICQGQSITIGGQTFNATGNYPIVLSTSLGCDSIVNLALTVNPKKTTNLTATICEGQSVTIGGQSFSTSGLHSVMLVSSAGCDSVVNLSLTVNLNKTTSISRTICQGGSVSIGGQTFNATGNYSVPLLTSTGCDSTVTLSLTVNPFLTPDVNLTADKNSLCPGQHVTFTANASNTGATPLYQWYINGVPTGSNSDQFSPASISNGDSVKVKITTNAACATPKTVTSSSMGVVVNSIAYNKPDVEYCQNTSYTIGDMIVIPSPDPNYIMSWTNGTQITTDSSSQYTIDNTTSTVIPFQIRYGGGCVLNDALIIKVNPTPRINATVDKPLVKHGEQVQLDVTSSTPVVTYNWTPTGSVSNPSIKNPTSAIAATTVFVVQVKDNKNCVNSDSVLVELIDDCTNDYIYVPTAFTPNNDDINDCFGIISPPQLTNYRMTIYDRWGEKVFETTNPLECWDGTFKGTDAAADSYVFLISFKCYNGADLSKKGTVTILK